MLFLCLLNTGFTLEVRAPLSPSKDSLILKALTAASKWDPIGEQETWALHIRHDASGPVVQLFNVVNSKKIDVYFQPDSSGTVRRVRPFPRRNFPTRHKKVAWNYTLAVVQAFRSFAGGTGAGLVDIRVSAVVRDSASMVCMLSYKPYQPWNETYGVIGRDGKILEPFAGSGY